MRLLTLITAAATLAFAGQAAAASQPEWVGHGPSGGTVSQIEIDPLHPDTMYAGTLGAGVFKSADSGRHWTRSSNGLPPDTSVLLMDVAASEPGTVYVSTRIAPQLFKTTDGGAHWAGVPSPPDTPSIADIDVDPADPQKLFVSTARGLYRSDDGGASWQREDAVSADSRHVAIAPSNPRVVYAFAGGSVLRSEDGGGTWSERSRTLADLDVFTVSPDDPNTLYTFGTSGEVKRSTDGGASFVSLYQAPPLSFARSSFAVAPSDPSRLYLTVPGTAVTSADRGASWTRLGSLPTGDIRDLDVSPADPGKAFVGVTHHGLHRLDGTSWRAANSGIAAQEVDGLAVAPSSGSTVYAGTWGGGVARTRNGGRTWRRAGLAQKTVFALAVAPRAPRTVLAAFGGRAARTTDAGAHWRRGRGLPADDYRSVSIAPSAPRVAYAGTFSHGLFRTRDGGRTWRHTKLTATIFAIAVHPRRPRTVWAAGAGLYRSRDGGRTWKTLPVDPGIELDAVAVDPRHPSVLYVGIDGGALIKSTDGGDQWTAPTAPPPMPSVQAIAIDPRHAGTAYAGGYDPDGRGGVYSTHDGGSAWSDITAGMTTTWTASLALSRDGSRLYAGTTAYGRESGGSVFATQVRTR